MNFNMLNFRSIRGIVTSEKYIFPLSEEIFICSAGFETATHCQSNMPILKNKFFSFGFRRERRHVMALDERFQLSYLGENENYYFEAYSYM